jgi:hypothetical protein
VRPKGRRRCSSAFRDHTSCTCTQALRRHYYFPSSTCDDSNSRVDRRIAPSSHATSRQDRAKTKTKNNQTSPTNKIFWKLIYPRYVPPASQANSREGCDSSCPKQRHWAERKLYKRKIIFTSSHRFLMRSSLWGSSHEGSALHLVLPACRY